MMPPLLWFGLMPPGGTGNIFIEMAARRNHKINFVEPCPLGVRNTIDHSWPYIYRRVPYVEKVEEEYGVGWRSMPWENYQTQLKLMVDEHAPCYTWGASFNSNTFNAVKEYFGHDCFSVSINYTSNDFDFLFKKWARWQTGLIMENPKYKNFQKRFTNSHELESYLLAHGSEEFGYTIPESQSASADLEISIRDLFDRTKFAGILDQLECQPSTEDWEFYDAYCNASG